MGYDGFSRDVFFLAPFRRAQDAHGQAPAVEAMRIGRIAHPANLVALLIARKRLSPKLSFNRKNYAHTILPYNPDKWFAEVLTMSRRLS
jgi:hypothetical protein